MKRVLIFALIAACVSIGSVQAQSAGEVTKTLIELENTWVDAVVRADTAKLNAILVDTYVDTEEGGHRSGKQETLAVLRSGDLKFKSIKLLDMKVYIYGDAAIVAGKAVQDGSFKGDPLKTDIVFTDTFVRQNGAWRAAASQRTAAPK